MKTMKARGFLAAAVLLCIATAGSITALAAWVAGNATVGPNTLTAALRAEMVLPEQDAVVTDESFTIGLEYDKEDVSSEAVWRVSDENVATISGGVLALNQGGDITVYAKWAGIEVEKDITVYDMYISTVDEVKLLTGNEYVVLTNDLTIEYDASAETDFLIQTLDGVFDGNGHTITITSAHTANTDSFHNFIGTIGVSGELVHTNFIYTETTAANINHGSALVRTNNGSMRDLQVSVTFPDAYVNNLYGYLSYDGSGVYENITVRVASGCWQGVGREDLDGAVGIVAASNEANGTAQNIVALGNMTGNCYVQPYKATHNVSAINVQAFVNGAAFAAADYDSSGFDAAIWEFDEYGVPRMKLPVAEIYSIADLEENANKHVNFKLMSDLVIAYDGSQASVYQIQTLNTVFDGNGHTITINVTHPSPDNSDSHRNIIETIGPSGEFRNAVIVYGIHMETNNINQGSCAVRVNNGTMRDISFTFSYTTVDGSWINGSFGYLSYRGAGLYKDIAITITNYLGGTTGDDAVKYAGFAGEGTIDNVTVS